MSDPLSPASPPTGDEGAQAAERVEHRWAAAAVIVIVLLVLAAMLAGVRQAAMPQSRVATVDPRTLHLSGEFIESNLGSAMEPDGSVTVRLIGQQYSFTPRCIVVPAGTPLTFRAASADAVHGLLITGSVVNLMLVPGYVSSIRARFETPGERYMPCQEFCGTGHEGMWGRVEVIDKAAFARLAAASKRLRCAD
jgi:cytochrome c oxidase subunit 2